MFACAVWLPAAAGRNIHALDPYRMPGPAAEARGAAAAQAVLDSHRAANGGAYPETVAINLWGLDAIKTKVGGAVPFDLGCSGSSYGAHREHPHRRLV